MYIWPCREESRAHTKQARTHTAHTHKSQPDTVPSCHSQPLNGEADPCEMCVVMCVQALEGLTRPHLDAVAHACQVPQHMTNHSSDYM